MATASNSAQTLKKNYRWRLFLVLIGNLVLLYAAITYDAISLGGIQAIAKDWEAAWKNIGSVGLAFAITTVINGLLSSDAKARLVFFRWRNPLPACRAFSLYLKRDPRIDFGALTQALGELPSEPTAQNATWYRLYATVKNDPVVLDVHEDFLFSRDYAGLSFLLLIFLGPAGAYAIPSGRTMSIYVAVLVLQLVATVWAARNYGIRLVTTAVATWQRGV